MHSKGRTKGSLAGMLASRIRGASSSDAKEAPESVARFTEIHMEPVTPLFDESDAASASSEASLAICHRIEVSMEEALEVVALPTSKLVETRALATHAKRTRITTVETKKPPLRMRRSILTRSRSAPAPKEEPQEREISNMKELLKRTLSLGLQRHVPLAALLDGVDVDSKSHPSTQPSTECGKRNESIECKAVDSLVQSRSFTHARSRSTECPRTTSHLAGAVVANNFAIHDFAATSKSSPPNDLDLLNVLTFIEMDAEEADWEETGVSAITAGSSYYGDATSSRRAVEGVPRPHCSKGGSLVDFRGTPAVDGDAKTNSDLFTFLEVSAIANDIDQPSSRSTDHLSPDLASTPFKYSAVEESKEFTYEDAVVIRDESNKEAKWHVSTPRHDMLMFDNRTQTLVEVENTIDESLVSLGDESFEIMGGNCDLGSRNSSLRCKAHRHEDRDGEVGGESLQSDFVEVLHTKGITIVAPGDFQTSQTVVKPENMSDIGSRTAAVACPSVVEGTDGDKKRTVQLHALLEVKLKEGNAGDSTATCIALPDRLATEKANSRSDNEKYLGRNDECTEASGVDYFEVPLELFELSRAGKGLDSEGSTFDDDSELAVIGKIATLASVSLESRDIETLRDDFEAVATMQPMLLSGVLGLAQVQSDFSASNFEATFRAATKDVYSLGQMESKPIEAVVDISDPVQITRDPDTMVQDIRKSLAVNGESALRILSIQLHEHSGSKTGPVLDENAVFTSPSRKALVDYDDASGDDELTQNQESKPLISRTLLGDTFLLSAAIDDGDVAKWIEPECEPAFGNLCVPEPVEQVMTTFTDPKQREHRSAGEEKKDDENPSTLDSVHFPTRVTRLSGGSFYESTKNASGYGKRPLYDEELTWGFLHGMMSSGVTLLQLRLPEAAVGNRNRISNERAVTMVVEPGSNGSIGRAHVVPRLQWTTIEVNPTAMRQTSSIGLLDIRSIEVNGDDELEVDSHNCFYVATRAGSVHVFQAGSTYDRDMFVIGIRNVIAWLCFHLAAGDVTAPSMLYSDGGDLVFDAEANSPDKFAAFHRLRQMNHLAHSLLD
jgi:hypothetical protein